MATVLKNVTNLFVIAGDYMFFHKSYGCAVWITLFMMLISAMFGAATDLQYNHTGYAWQLINCFFTASYSLYLRGAMDQLLQLTESKSKPTEFSMVFYNNVLSLPLLFGLMWHSGELHMLWKEPALTDMHFLISAVASSVLAFCISFASLWFLSTTTATTYSLVGSLNKIPVAMVGFVLFATPCTPGNFASILISLAACVVFSQAKQASVK